MTYTVCMLYYVNVHPPPPPMFSRPSDLQTEHFLLNKRREAKSLQDMDSRKEKELIEVREQHQNRVLRRAFENRQVKYREL